MGNPNKPLSFVKNMNLIIYRELNKYPIFRLYIGIVLFFLILLILKVIYYFFINS